MIPFYTKGQGPTGRYLWPVLFQTSMHAIAKAGLVLVLMGGALTGQAQTGDCPTVTFDAFQRLYSSFIPSTGAIGDLNGDGKADMVVVSYSGNVGVLLNNGGGTIARLNADGSPDLGFFAPIVTYGSGGESPRSVAIGDVNGDGKADLVVTNQYYPNSWTVSFNIGVLLNNGDGTFAPAATYGDSGGHYAAHVVIGDLNGDGKPDLARAKSSSNNVSVLLNNGDGTFAPAVDYESGGIGPQHVVIGDVNGDGKLDLAVANRGFTDYTWQKGNVGVLLNNGDGTFAPAVVYESGGSWTIMIEIGDLNGDGKPDLVVTNSTSTVEAIGVLLNNGDGTFAPTVMYNGMAGTTPLGTIVAPYAGYWVAIGDLNGDGKPDLATANRKLAAIGVLLNKGDGTFARAVNYALGSSDPAFVALGDLNGDGKLDVMSTSRFGRYYVAISFNTTPCTPEKAPQTITFAPIADKTYGDAAFAISASASSGLGVSISTTGGISYDATTGLVTITGAGPASITAAQAGNVTYQAAPSVTHNFTVAQAANSIMFTNPGSKTYGDAPFDLSASATSGGSVSFAVVSGPATLSGNRLTITGAGDITVEAASGATTNYGAAVNERVTFTVNKANQVISWSTPANITYGTALSLAQLNATVTTGDGALTYTPAVNAVLNAGTNQTLSVTAAATDNYNEKTETVQITVDKADATITLTVGGPYTADGNAKPATATTDPADLDGLSVTYDGSATAPSAPGSYAVVASLTNGNYAATAQSGTLTINPAVARATTLTLSVNPASVQYSDQVTLTAMLKESANNVEGKAISFTLGTQTASGTTNASGVAAAIFTLTQGAENVAISAAFAGDAQFLTSTSPAATYTITREDATLTYNGDAYRQTASATDNQVDVQLSGSVYEVADASAGDITKAKVDFTGEAAIAQANIDVNGTAASGTASTSKSVQLTTSQVNAGGNTYEVVARASGNFYTGAADRVAVTVALPGADFATGGGSSNANGSTGTYAASNGTRMYFGFNMKQNKAMKNMPGQVTVLFRRTEDGVVNTYRIRSTSIAAMTAPTVDGQFRKSVITSKATLTRISPNGTETSVATDLDLTTDAWEAVNGGGHRLAVALSSAGSKKTPGEVLFSSSSSPQNINGTIRLFTGANARESFEVEPVLLKMNVDVVASPNPVADQLNVVITEAGSQPSVRVQLFGIDQRLHGTYKVPVVEGHAGLTIDVKTLQEGLYILTVDGAHGRVSRKVLKMN